MVFDKDEDPEMKHITGRQALDITKEYFPSATDQEAWGMLISFTGWPSFWNTNDVEAEIRASYDEVTRVIKSGQDPFKWLADKMDAAMEEAWANNPDLPRILGNPIPTDEEV